MDQLCFRSYCCHLIQLLQHRNLILPLFSAIPAGSLWAVSLLIFLVSFHAVHPPLGIGVARILMVSMRTLLEGRVQREGRDATC